jgi:hypothetical protein
VRPSIVVETSTWVKHNTSRSCAFKETLTLKKQLFIMKFTSSAVALALLVATHSGADAFAPQSRPFVSTSALKATATSTPVYTFTKSEEIFAEAQNVRFLAPFYIGVYEQALILFFNRKTEVFFSHFHLVPVDAWRRFVACSRFQECRWKSGSV